MANSTSGRVWIIDTAGAILSETPVLIKKVVFIPAAQDDDVEFREFTNTTVAAGSLNNKTGTITDTNKLTSTGNLPATILDGYVFDIVESSGTADNHGKKLVKTAGDTNAVVVWGAWTNEANKVYTWKTYTTFKTLVLKAGASDASPVGLDFGDRGRRFMNLIIETLDGGTVYLYTM